MKAARVNITNRRLIVTMNATRWNKTPGLDEVDVTLPCLPCKLHRGLKTDAHPATYHLLQEHTFKIIEVFFISKQYFLTVFQLPNNFLRLLFLPVLKEY
jgi:hypothetical protein